MSKKTAAGPEPAPETAAPLDPLERAVNAFEYAAWHLGSAFARWRRDCLAAMPGAEGLAGTEASILHVIHLNRTPKGLSEIARLLHRDDLANLQYGLKKLLSLGLIEKAGGASRRLTTYRPTIAGQALIDAYLQRRRDTLLRLAGGLSGTTDAIQQASVVLHVMAGLYDQASTILSGHHGTFGEIEP